MHADACQYLFGSDVPPIDLDDDDAVATWAASEFFEGSAHDCDDPTHDHGIDDAEFGQLAVPVIRSIARGDAAAWDAAQRSAAAGLGRGDVVAQMTDAFAAHVAECLRDGLVPSDPDDPDDPAAAAAAAALAARYDALPLPLDLDGIEAALADVIGSAPGATWEAAVAGATARIGAGPNADLCAEPVELVLDALVDAGTVAIAGEDVLVHLPSVSDGAVLTHRFTDAELTIGVLSHVASDLALFAHHDVLRTGDGVEIEVFSAEPGHLGWVAESGWLADIREGEVVAVRVDRDGTVTFERATPPPVDPGLVALIEQIVESQSAETELPLPMSDLCAALELEAPGRFLVAMAPLSEVVDATSLERRGGRVAADPGHWDRLAWVERASRLRDRGLDGDPLLAVMDAIGLIESSALDPAALVTIRRALAADAVCELVADELIDVDGRWGDVERAREATEELIVVAGQGRDEARARVVAAIVAERAGDLSTAEEHLRAAQVADPECELVIDRLAWYASDRGDAITAARLWGRIDGDPGELALVRRHAAASGPTVDTPGRNDACWCGSGRKYKACHLGKPVEAALADRVDWMCRKATSWLVRRHGASFEAAIDLAVARAVDPADHHSVSEALADPLVFDVVLTELGFFDRFLAERGRLLPDDERALFAEWAHTRRSVFEVVAADPATGVALGDRLSGETLELREATLATMVPVGALIMAHAVPDGDAHQLIGGVVEVSEATLAEAIVLCETEDADGICAFAREQALTRVR